MTDVVVTSSNAQQIVSAFPEEQPLIFGPDKNLGSYINAQTGRRMLLWDGACHVHERFSMEQILQLKRTHPEALVLAHPECKAPVLQVADVIGSTARLLKVALTSDAKEFIVATESGILHEMRKGAPQKTFIPVPPDISEGKACACNECHFMKLNTLEKLYQCLQTESPEIDVPEDIRLRAVKPIERMLQMSEELGL